MTTDPYAALGVPKTASDAEIKKAYRKIVRDSHPDINPDDPDAEERFKKASAAFDLLKDPETRARFDRGEIDATGAERPERRFYREYAEAPGQGFGQGGFEGFSGHGDAGDFFSEIFRQRGASGGSRGFHAKGQDLRFTMEVDFLDAANGTTQRITLPTGDRLEVKIPKGTADGQTIRLRGKGAEGIGEGGRGDALITVSVRPHAVFRREGKEIHVTLPITLDEAILGGKVPVPTIDGTVNLTVPKGASGGQVLRMKGRGINGGDQKVELRITMPKKVDSELADFIERWRETNAYDPRKGVTS